MRPVGANRDELSPLALLRRSAEAYPDRPAVRDGERTLSFAALRRARVAARHGASRRGRRPGGARRDALAQPPRAARGAFRRARGARRAVRDQHPPRPARGALHRRALRRARAAARSRARGGGEPGGRAARVARRAARARVRGAARGRAAAPPEWPDSEDRPIAVDYTSGTTGTPKGVVYTHRGAYLGALADLVETRLGPDSTLPLDAADVPLQRLVLHLGAWPASAPRASCLPRPEPAAIWRELRAGATHLARADGADHALLAHPDAAPLDHAVPCVDGGAPPSPTLIERCEALGIRLIHLYGLTETYGPATVCAWPPEWDALPAERARRAARPPGRADRARRRGRRVGSRGRARAARRPRRWARSSLRGNTVMAGYLDDAAATAEAFRGGWFHSGDAAVVHEDGRIELRDRFKDVIISGGENISTIEVEQVLARHPGGARVRRRRRSRTTTGASGRRRSSSCARAWSAGRGADRHSAASNSRGFKCPDAVEYGDAPAHGHRQGPEVRAARTRMGRPRTPRQLAHPTARGQVRDVPWGQVSQRLGSGDATCGSDPV